jgi:hypothetical protein
MFVDKTLCEEVKSIKGKLDNLERQSFGQKLDELQKATREFEMAQHGKMEELQKSNQKLALRLARLQGIAAVLFAMLSGVAIYYLDQYHKQVDRNISRVEQIMIVQPEAYELLLGMLQDKFGDILDRISLFAPTEQDRAMVAELDELQQKLRRLGIEKSEKFVALSELVNVLKLIVNEGKAKEASALLDEKALSVNNDRFIASRALVLQAMTLIQPSQQCDDPERIIALVDSAIKKDSRVAAAFNLLGVCQAEESITLMHKQPEQWQRSGGIFQAALRNNELAYQFKPTQWSKARLLNNRAWVTTEFLFAALAQNKLNESLHWTGYKTINEFIEQSVKDLEECQALDQRHPSYLETLAELYGLECAYYKNPSYEDNRKAEDAYEKMVKALMGAIDKGLLRKMNDLGEAQMYFSKDNLLAPLFADPQNPWTLDSKIKAQIERRMRFH